MHGISRNNEKYNKELTKEDTDKAKLFFDTIDDLNKAYDINDKKVTWNALSKFKKYSYNLLKLNPDILIAWSTRKKILNLIITRDIIQEIKEQFKEEFGIIDGALMENIKSYNAWSYRQWCMTQLFNFDNPEKIYDYSSEKNLFNKVFEFDARNFHCWDYFRFFSNISKNEIFLKDQVNKLITKDFSNFSAWFQNSINSSTKCPNEYNLKYLDRDLEMVNNAIYMDSNDQSSWIYLNWLIGQVSNSKSIMPICVFNKKKAKFVFWNLVLVDSMKFVIYYKNAKDTVTGDYIKPSETTFFCEFNYNYRFESMQKCEFIITYGCNDKQYYERFVVFDNSQEENNYEQFEKDGLVRMNLSRINEEYTQVIENELTIVKELLNLGDKNKWIYMGLIDLKNALYLGKDDYSDEFKILADIDSYRVNCYKHMKIRYNLLKQIRTKLDEFIGPVDDFFTKIELHLPDQKLEFSKIEYHQLSKIFNNVDVIYD